MMDVCDDTAQAQGPPVSTLAHLLSGNHRRAHHLDSACTPYTDDDVRFYTSTHVNSIIEWCTTRPTGVSIDDMPRDSVDGTVHGGDDVMAITHAPPVTNPVIIITPVSEPIQAQPQPPVVPAKTPVVTGPALDTGIRMSKKKTKNV
jgi:hypothetical protein